MRWLTLEVKDGNKLVLHGGKELEALKGIKGEITLKGLLGIETLSTLCTMRSLAGEDAGIGEGHLGVKGVNLSDKE